MLWWFNTCCFLFRRKLQREAFNLKFRIKCQSVFVMVGALLLVRNVRDSSSCCFDCSCFFLFCVQTISFSPEGVSLGCALYGVCGFQGSAASLTPLSLFSHLEQTRSSQVNTKSEHGACFCSSLSSLGTFLPAL